MNERPRKPLPLVAIIVFGMVYLGALVLIFAPEGSFGSRSAEVWQAQ